MNSNPEVKSEEQAAIEAKNVLRDAHAEEQMARPQACARLGDSAALTPRLAQVALWTGTPDAVDPLFHLLSQLKEARDAQSSSSRVHESPSRE